MTDEIIDKISKLVTKEDASESDVDHLLTLVRKLEEKNSGGLTQYPVLDLFCDWTKHPVLDRSAGQQVVIKLNERLRYLLDNPKDKEKLVEDIRRIISFEQLQNDLISFFEKYGIPLDLVTKKELWLRFVVLLIEIISDCPLELPERRRGRVLQDLGNGVVATSMAASWNNIGDRDVLTLNIELSNGRYVLIPCKVLGIYLEKHS